MCKAAMRLLALVLAQRLAVRADPDFEWVLIARQHISHLPPKNDLFHTLAKDTLLMNPFDEYAAISAHMDVGNFCKGAADIDFAGKYRFKLVWDSQVTVEWEQSSWLSESEVTGFACYGAADCVPETQEEAKKRFHGLRMSSSPRCVLDSAGGDDAQGQGGYWNQIGVIRGSDIKAWNGEKAEQMELFIARKLEVP